MRKGDEPTEAKAGELEVKLNVRDAKIIELESKLAEERTRTKVLRAQLTSRERDLQRLMASNSWRLTKPLRAVYDCLPGALPLRWKLWLRFRMGRYDWTPKVLHSTGDLPLRQIGIQGLDSKCVPLLSQADDPLPSSKISFPVEQDPEISIIIPVFGRFGLTLKCLRTLKELVGERRFEVIIVDDGSLDETADSLPTIPGICYLRNKTNLGFIHSCNRGSGVARGRFLFFLNNDAHPQKGSLDMLIRTFDLHHNIGLVGAKLYHQDGTLQEAGGIVWSDGSAWNYGRGDDPRKPEYNYLRNVDYSSGAALMIPAFLWLRVGGFDPYYTRAYYEDTDLAFRVRKKGFRVVYQPFAKIIHSEGSTSGTDENSGEKRYQAQNRRKFFLRWVDELHNHRPNGESPELERDRMVVGRVLIIDAGTPTPDKDSGSLYLLDLIKMLHEMGFKTTFIPQRDLRYFGKYTDDLQMYGTECLYRPFIRSLRRYLVKCGASYDYVIINRIHVFTDVIDDVKRYCRQARIVFNTVDLHFLRKEREANLCQDAKLQRQALNTKDIELAMMRKADATIVVSNYEKEKIQREDPDIAVRYLPLIQEIIGRPRPFEFRRNICFVGGFLHSPNRDAVHHFVADIWPYLRSKLPDAYFFIVGSHMPDSIKRLDKIERVEAIGFVEDLTGFLADIRLTVAPLRYGAGTKGKIISSMCHGIPVIGSPIAVEGIECQHGTHVLVPHTIEEWVDCVVRAYQNEDLWNNLSKAGIALMQRNHSLEVGLQRLSEILNIRHCRM